MANNIVLLTIFAALILLGACSSKETGAPESQAAVEQKETKTSLSVQVFDKENVPFSNIATQPLPALVLTGENKTVEITNCQELVNNIPQYSVEETTNNMQVYGDYQICVISWLIDHAKPANRKFVAENFSSTVIDELDLSSFGSSLGPRLEDNKQTLSAFEFGNITKTADKVTINDEGWLYEITLLARGDFNNDGIEDLLVRFLDQSGDASYFSLQTLLLEKPSKDAKVTAIDAVKLIKP
jgi:hypothetical protein